MKQFSNCFVYNLDCPLIRNADGFFVEEVNKRVDLSSFEGGVFSSPDPAGAQKLLNKISAFYRVYVREGQTEVEVQDWTQINRTPNEYYFIFDTRDKIPNEYYIDIKVESSGEVNTYKRQIKFQVVNMKNA